MRVQIEFLGTGSTTPTPDRNHTSIQLAYGGDRLLFDCGEGTQRQMATAKLSVVKIRAIMLTHLHGDHILGLPGFLLTCRLRSREEPLYIYGPEGTKEMLENIRGMIKFNAYPEFNIVVHEVSDGLVFETEDYSVSCFPVDHDVPAVGYVFLEKDRINIDEKALRALGLEPGPEYRALKKGESVEWDGKTLKPEKFLSASKGLKIVYTGDCTPGQRVLEAAEGADLLIHESTFAQEIRENAVKYKHSTAKDAGVMAREANVKQLVITHFSTRYKNEDLYKLLDEAKKEFENTVMASDFMVIEL